MTNLFADPCDKLSTPPRLHADIVGLKKPRTRLGNGLSRATKQGDVREKVKAIADSQRETQHQQIKS
jgi:hypothetical protein